jgi:hypothetical protein
VTTESNVGFWSLLQLNEGRIMALWRTSFLNFHACVLGGHDEGVVNVKHGDLDAAGPTRLRVLRDRPTAHDQHNV